MKVPLMLVALFALLTLCLPLVAVGSQPLSAVQAAAPPAAPSGAKTTAPPKTTVPTEAPAQTPAPAEPEEPAGQTIELEDNFRILNLATGKVQRVNRGDYVRGAVCAEMPPSFHTQALAAQAVAANTYAVRCKLEQKKNPDPALKGADFSADPDNWRGYVTEKQAKERFGDKFEVYWGKICEAADLGSSYVAVFEEEPIVAAYHSISAGQTEYAANVWQGNAPYLAPVESFGDTLAEGFESNAVFTAQEVKERLLAENSAIKLGDDRSKWLRVVSRSESGYVLDVNAGGQSLTGKDIRRIFELRSSDFDLANNGNSFTFTVRGYGHGVGLSQYGADYMARQGATFDEIVLHYYTGCELRAVAA